MDPYGEDAALKAMADAGVVAFAMELMPRITRAQVMDVLSSQANLAGYRAVIDAAAEYGRALPMMMTAAGTVPAAQGVRHGRGRRRPAGDRDRAPARRGRHRHRRAAGGQGAGREPRRQVRRGRGRGVQAGRDRRPATPRRCRRSIRPSRPRWSPTHIKKQDIVITTALIPGRPAPRLVSKDDGRLACGPARSSSISRSSAAAIARSPSPARWSTSSGVKIVGYLNVPGRIAGVRLEPLRQEPLAFLEILVDKATKALARQMGRRDRQGDRAHPRRRRRCIRALRRKRSLTARVRCPSDAGVIDRCRDSRKSRDRAPRRLRCWPNGIDADAAQARRESRRLASAPRAAAYAATGGAVDPFVFRFSIFVLAIFVGYYVVWSVTPALHTPLMSVTNAISSVIVVGALLAVGVALAASMRARSGRACFGFVALILASVNIFGGFLVTQRMLGMYQEEEVSRR